LKITKLAFAGTMESSDAYIEIEPSANGREILVESVVNEQFGESIKTTVEDVLNENGIESAVVRVNDRGALECVIRARVETAILRGKGEE